MTAALIGLCLLIKRHYNTVAGKLRRLDTILDALPPAKPSSVSTRTTLDPRQDVAVLLVGSYGGLGVHQLLTVQRIFRGHYKNLLFASVGVIDAVAMKGVAEVDELKHRTEESLQRYVDLAHRLGLKADYRLGMGTEAVAEAEKLCISIARELPNAIFFAGKLVFQRENLFQRVLHNETAYQLQRRLQFAGLNSMVLPVRVLEEVKVPAVVPQVA